MQSRARAESTRAQSSLLRNTGYVPYKCERATSDQSDHEGPDGWPLEIRSRPARTFGDCSIESRGEAAGMPIEVQAAPRAEMNQPLCLCHWTFHMRRPMRC